MNDLIWVGNTLYPRWFVFAVIGSAFLILAGVWTWLTRGSET